MEYPTFYSHWEYEKGYDTLEILYQKGKMVGISQNELKEYNELKMRIDNYINKSNKDEIHNNRKIS